jgi:hypothetical protein
MSSRQVVSGPYLFGELQKAASFVDGIGVIRVMCTFPD